VVTFGPTVSIWLNVTLFVLRSILNPSSLFELSAQDKSISKQLTAVAVKLDGALGVGIGVGLGVGVGVPGVGVGVQLGAVALAVLE
jgi:hypothetical protein